MRDASVVISDLQIVVHAGRETSSQFAVDLLWSVFDRSEIEPNAFAG
jgi:hypothetical protein